MNKILARPGFRSPNGESSSLLIAREINKLGYDIVDWNSLFDTINYKYDYILLHWPDNILKDKMPLFLLKYSALISSLFYFRYISKSKIIWFAHNIKSHYKVSEKKEKFFWKYFFKNIDVIIYPLPSIKKIHTNYVNVNNIKKIIIPFGPYSKRNLDDYNLKKLKDTLNIEKNTTYFLWFGLIRPYKNLELIIDTFDSLSNNYKIIIAGQVIDEDYFSNLNTNNNVIFYPKFIEDDEFPLFFEICKACIFNYKNITNSGSIRLALTYNKLTFCNYFTQLDDFNKILDTNYLKFYKNSSELKKLILSINDLELKQPNWNKSSWENFTSEFEKKVINVK